MASLEYSVPRIWCPEKLNFFLDEDMSLTSLYACYTYNMCAWYRTKISVTPHFIKTKN